MIWGVNLGANNVSNAVAEAQAIRETFSYGGAAANAGVILDAIEIGNEADLYENNALRGNGWNVDEYISQWTSFAKAIISGAGLSPNSSPSLMVGSFANSVFGGDGFSPQYLFNNGLLSSSIRPYVSQVSQHHYSGSFCSGDGGLLQDLMAQAGIRSNITQFSGDIGATFAQGLTYVFGETNSYACHGAPGVSNTAGAAIWTLDYALQAATRGILRVHFHNGIGFKYNLIQPDTLTRSTTTGQNLSSPQAPHVQPQYYAAIIAAFASSASADNSIITNITDLDIDDPSGNVAGYGIFDNGRLARAILINSNAWLTTSSGSRPVVTLVLTVSSLINDPAAYANDVTKQKSPNPSATLPTSVQVRRLATRYTDDASGLTFAGISYETSSGSPSGTDTYTTTKISKGAFQVTISSTEVALLTFVY